MVAAAESAIGTDSTAAPGPVLGLTEDEARARRARGQGNRVRAETGRTYAQIVKDNLFTFINVTLVGIGLILVAMGQTKDAILSAGLVVINVAAGVVQEAIAKRRLDRIALLTRAKATVIRDGEERAIDPNELVLGDLLVVRPGDQLAVDGRVVGDGAIEVDESLLTGESEPIAKHAGDQVYAGSFCVAGSARFGAERVGGGSLASTITAGARAYRVRLTPLQKDVNLIVRILLFVAGFYLAMVLLGSLIWQFPFRDTVVAAAIVVGIVPSGLFLMITVTYSMAALRLASRSALVQQMNAIESLSNVDVFCMDKTGTLTANRLQLAAVQPIGGDEATLRQMVGNLVASASVGNKTSEAIAAAAPGKSFPLVDEVPFSSDRKWSAVAADADGFRGVFALGAAEMLAPHLAGAAAPPPPTGWAERGWRLLLVAYAPEPAPLHAAGAPVLPPTLAPAGWLGFTDELRPGLADTLDGFRRADVALKIISGDNPETVAALARQAGLVGDAKLVSGLDLDGMDDNGFSQAATDATVFGRITPEQKARLVEALRGRGHYVAMTGDGVNDVLSLKQANLGIAMQSGSQATRAAADIVLLNDSFAAVPAALREGRRVRRGLQGVLDLFLARAFAVALIILMVAVVQAGFPFSPGHMTLLTLLTVGIPTFGLGLWAHPGTVPRSVVRSVFGFVFPAAFLLAVAAFGIYLLFYFLHDVDLPALRAGGVIATTAAPETDRLAKDALTYVLVLGGLWLVVFAAPPVRFWAVVEDATGDWRPTILALAMLPLYAMAVAVPWLRDFFGVRVLGAEHYAWIFLVVLIWAFALRLVWRMRALDRLFGVQSQPRMSQATSDGESGARGSVTGRSSA